MQALKQELGPVNDTYLIHADLDGITFKDDGSVDSESLLQVANKFRQEHGQLIPKVDNVNITSQAASSLDNFPQKTVDQMSKEEKVAALMEIYKNKQ